MLAGGADRDVSDVRSQLRAQRGLLQALRDTQVEHGDRLDRLERRMTAVELRHERTGGPDRRDGRAAHRPHRRARRAAHRPLDALQAEMREGFAKIGAGMAHIVTLLERDE